MNTETNGVFDVLAFLISVAFAFIALGVSAFAIVMFISNLANATLIQFLLMALVVLSSTVLMYIIYAFVMGVVKENVQI